MKKYVDWEKIEKEIVSAEEACECTRSKLQSLIAFLVELLPKRKEPSCCDKINQADKGQCNDN